MAYHSDTRAVHARRRVARKRVPDGRRCCALAQSPCTCAGTACGIGGFHDRRCEHAALHRDRRRRAQEQLHLSLTGVANEVALDFVVHPANATQVAVTLNGAPVSADCATATINAYT